MIERTDRESISYQEYRHGHSERLAQTPVNVGTDVMCHQQKTDITGIVIQDVEIIPTAFSVNLSARHTKLHVMPECSEEPKSQKEKLLLTTYLLQPRRQNRHAIVYIPVPCEEACPVKAISKDEYGVEHIDPEKCIYCGKCLNACPFGAIFDQCAVFDVLNRIKEGRQVVAMVAPSVLAQFKQPVEKVFGALKAIGFSDVLEVAYGAEETIRREAEEFKEKLESGAAFMTTSCCSAYVQLARKHIPEIMPYVSSTGSPMYYVAEYARKKHPEALTVFIAPCASKKAEGRENPNVDFVWTFRELDAVIEGMEIDMAACEDFTPEEHAGHDAHGFAKTGGVFTAVKNMVGDPELQGTLIADLNKKNIAALRAYAKTGKCPTRMIEVMACPGGCISGPCACNEGMAAIRQFDAELKKKE